MRRVTASV